MPTIGTLTSFTANTTAQAAQVSTNFSTIRTACNTYGAWLDAASQTFTGNQTINPSSGVALTITDGGLTVTAGGITITAGGLTVSADGVTVTGNSTITGTLGGVTTLTCTTVTATNLGGTLTTAAQPNVTSVGTLTTATITTLTFATATPSGTSPVIRTGSTDLYIKNSAGSTNIARFVSTGGVILYGTSSAEINVATAGSAITLNAPSSLVGIGAAGLSTSATGGHMRIPTTSGTPTGAVDDGCMVVDTSNHILYVRSGSAWKSTTLS